MKFEQLLTLFQETHLELQKRAAQSVDIALVIRTGFLAGILWSLSRAGPTVLNCMVKG